MLCISRESGRVQGLGRLLRRSLALGALALAALPQAHAAGTWQTTLQGRDLDGNSSNGFEAYYDTDLNITWLSNASYAGVQMTWADAKTWAANLDVFGITGWRLPAFQARGTSGCAADGSVDCGYNFTSTTSELAHLYYVTLGNKGYVNYNWTLTYSGFTQAGPFKNVGSRIFWLDSEYLWNNGYAWSFGTTPYGNFAGLQDGYLKLNSLNAWAVHSGDVAPPVPVPEPASYALALAGLAFIGAVARRRR